jgi:hypothetical protein
MDVAEQVDAGRGDVADHVVLVVVGPDVSLVDMMADPENVASDALVPVLFDNGFCGLSSVHMKVRPSPGVDRSLPEEILTRAAYSLSQTSDTTAALFFFAEL